jgi:hypothetical protein
MSRGIVLMALALLANAAAYGQADTWRFRVLLDEREIGTHDFSVRRDGAAEIVTSSARYRVKLFFVDAYQYAHDSRERWEAGCLQQIEAATDDNGKRLAVRGRRDGGTLAIEGAAGAFKTAECVSTFAYWNRAMLERRKLLNAQTGEYQDVKVRALGDEPLALPGGAVRAQRYALVTSDFRIDVWYAPDGRWLALESGTPGGRTLRYLPR